MSVASAIKNNRPSRQQCIVAQSVLHRFDHPTAEMVWLTARRRDAKISLATVYRNLEKLVDDGKIDKFAVHGEADHYEPNTADHIHARCTNCQQIFDINFNLTRRVGNKVRREIGFEVDGCQIMADGLCKKCNNKVRK
ncbi:MAG: transcriptional repressor [Candidatus Nomurabacteria bacterium]|jgi:Fur family peroxide stress response transcriptional regulator|nr:transcriptional repressor [Candidatus Nomurabacteria bacterium]